MKFSPLFKEFINANEILTPLEQTLYEDFIETLKEAEILVIENLFIDLKETYDLLTYLSNPIYKSFESKNIENLFLLPVKKKLNKEIVSYNFYKKEKPFDNNLKRYYAFFDYKDSLREFIPNIELEDIIFETYYEFILKDDTNIDITNINNYISNEIIRKLIYTNENLKKRYDYEDLVERYFDISDNSIKRIGVVWNKKINDKKNINKIYN